VASSRLIWGYVTALTAAAALGLLLGWSNAGLQADRWAYDLLLRLHPPPPQRSSCLILAIDEESLNTYGGIAGIRAPLAAAIETLARHEPAALAVDIVLSEPRSPEENAPLERALAAAENVVLATHLRAGVDSPDTAWEEPLEAFQHHATALGHVHAEPDEDAVCRRVLLAKAGGRTRRWAMALEAYRLAHGGGKILETDAGLAVNDAFIPAAYREDRALRIWYPNPESSIERLSLKSVLERPESAAAARGRVVFIGVDVMGSIDRYLMTPYSYGQPMSGVVINASLYETLAHGRFLVTAPETAVLAAALIFAMSLGVIFWRLAGTRALAAAGAVLLAAALTPLVFFQTGRVLSFAPPTLVAWLCFLSGGAYHYLTVRGRLSLAEAQRSRYQRAVHYITHEMRTPLTAIQGSSELISRHSLSEEKQKQMAGLIHRESQRLARMVEIFLSVERLSSGQLQLRRETVDADEMLGACIERALPLAGRKQIEIDHHVNGRNSIWGDREFLEYACYNLITNAVKYSPAQTAITVRSWQQRNSVLISVEDRGYGMDAQELRNIFQKFYRTKRAQESGESGTGLGLAIVEEIVVQHGGSIEVESRVNQGSRFTVSLPLATGQQGGDVIES
jgi:signal transduction histidine kinase